MGARDCKRCEDREVGGRFCVEVGLMQDIDASIDASLCVELCINARRRQPLTCLATSPLASQGLLPLLVVGACHVTLSILLATSPSAYFMVPACHEAIPRALDRY